MSWRWAGTVQAFRPPFAVQFGRGAYSLHKGPPGSVHGKWAVKHKLPERGMARPLNQAACTKVC